MEIDLSQEEESGPVPAGKYPVMIKYAEDAGVSMNGNPKIKLTYELTHDSGYEGRTIYDYLTITPKALWRVRQVLEATGQIEPGYKGKISLRPAQLVGQEVLLELGEPKGTYINKEGEERKSRLNTVIGVESLASGTKTPF